MVKLNVKSDKGESYEQPDLFRAARNDDVAELAAALREGQTLNDIQDGKSGLTAIHIACIHRSTDFLNAALELDFDPWIRDVNLRLAIDHARAQGLTEIQRKLFQAMYPPGWADEAEVVDMPRNDA